MNSMAKKRREGEANSPRGQRPARASQVGPSWSEFVRLAHQAVVAFAGTDMINRAEPRACGYSREPIGLDSEPDPKGTQARRQTWPETATEGRRATRLGLQPYWGKPAVRDETRGWGNRQHDLMAICHDARKSRNIGSHWSKPGAPPPYSTGAGKRGWRGCYRAEYEDAGCCWVRQWTEPRPRTRSTAWMPITGRSLKSSASVPSATRSFASLNVGTSTAALAM